MKKEEADAGTLRAGKDEGGGGQGVVRSHSRTAATTWSGWSSMGECPASDPPHRHCRITRVWFVRRLDYSLPPRG